MDLNEEVDINATTYQWSVRIFSILKGLLSVNIKMHHEQGQIATGEIFLFNHFARFETFIPQYLIYQETGAYCRSVAASEFFEEDDAFTNYLLSVGAVPNKHNRLITYLAGEILRGRKVIIFPEGGMVKDRRIQNRKGVYSIYSRTADERRKHHSGAAALSLTVDLVKKVIQRDFLLGQNRRIKNWSDTLGFEDDDKLFEAVRRPSTIIPANITFYPMRVGGNLLHRGVELINRGISRRLSEELLIESNILLKNTDMDIRLGETIFTDRIWRWWERPLIKKLSQHIASLEDLIPAKQTTNIGQQLLSGRIRKHSNQLRNSYMHAMYDQVTVNLSHLAAQIIFHLLEQKREQVDANEFHLMLYLAVQYLQEIPSIHLHRSLRNPETYGELVEGNCSDLDQFFRTAAQLELIELENHQYHFLPKLCQEHAFDEIRLENMVDVFANEAKPVKGIADIIKRAIADAPKIGPQQLANFYFQDEMRSYQWDKAYFSKEKYQEINAKETATQSGEPFFLLPKERKKLGIVLIHGFLSTPSETRGFGERLAQLGYPVIGPRLKGHGTSPWDLRERSWKDWLSSVRDAYKMLLPFCDRICPIGFSTGGALSLLIASEQPDCLAGTVAISAPIKFRDKNMMFVPLVHHANKLTSWLPSYEGIMPFRPNETEHPEINYRSMPVHSLFELRLMVAELKKSLPDVHCPALILQPNKDPVVIPESANIIYEKLGSRSKILKEIPSERHGIMYENIASTQELIIGYLDNLHEIEGDSSMPLQDNQCNIPAT